jgi:prephenate dehydrogenase
MGLASPVVGIVGGTGRMGKWFADLLEGQGLTVYCAGRRTSLTPSAMVRKSDVVVISVPIASTIHAIRELGPLVQENGLLMDLTSIKEGPLEAMLEHSRAEVIGMHPLFGPEEAHMPGQKVVICPGRGERGLSWMKEILEKAELHVLIMDPQEHDRMMGLIQGASHFSTLALAVCISRSGFGFEDVRKCSTRNFLRRLDRIREIVEQPSGLFKSLLMDNPGAAEFIDRYGEAVEEMMGITRQRDAGAFKAAFNSLKSFFRTNGKHEVM